MFSYKKHEKFHKKHILGNAYFDYYCKFNISTIWTFGLNYSKFIADIYIREITKKMRTNWCAYYSVLINK